MTDLPRIPTRAAAWRWPALLIGLVASAICVVAAIQGHTPLFRAYLYAYLFWLGITLGSMTIGMIHNLTGGRWGIPIRRALDAAGLMLPLMIVLFIPIILGRQDLYAWSRPDFSSELVSHRAAYLNVPFFIIRAAIYLALWTTMAILLSVWSRRWMANRDPRAAAYVRRLSGAGLVLYLMTITHAAIDWIMSRDPDFYSTMFGFILATSQAVVAMAFLILVAFFLPDPSAPPLPPPADHANDRPVSIDLGNLQFTMLILWAYIAFFQFLVIWMGNLRDDNSWYLERGFGGGGQPSPWIWIALALLVLHFFVPFFLLLFRGLKRRPAVLAGIAGLIVVMHLVHDYWLVAPSGPHIGPIFDPHWIDFVTPLAIGGLWLFFFLSVYERRPLVVAPLPLTAGQEGLAHA